MISFNNVTYSYPFSNKPAVEDISFSLNEGELVLCTGKSGCGKSTLIRLINGLSPHYYKGELFGEINISGVSTLSKTVGEISEVVGTLFQDPEQQFFALNVEDELAFALEWKGCNKNIIKEKIENSSKKFNLDSIIKSSIHTLSEGQKQKVGLGGIFANGPKVIVLDEPTANLDPESVIELGKTLLELKRSGITLFVADHRLYWLKGIADKVIIMDNGKITTIGEFSILNNKEVRKKYGLRSMNIFDKRKELSNCETFTSSVMECINVKNMSFSWIKNKPIFSSVSFSIPYGITLLSGSNGVGKTTLAKILIGLVKTQAGEFFINEKSINKKTMLKDGAIVLQNADHQLYMNTVIEEIEICLKLSNKNITKEVLNNKSLLLLKKFNLSKVMYRHPQSLSGGEKQRLVIASAFAKDPNILILDEPTSGLDWSNMKKLADLLKLLKDKKVLIILITHDLEFIEMVCDNLLQLPFNK